MKMVCPECDEPVVKRPPVRSGWSISVDPKRLEYSHPNGEPLCPVMTSTGYQPGLPKKG